MDLDRQENTYTDWRGYRHSLARSVGSEQSLYPNVRNFEESFSFPDVSTVPAPESQPQTKGVRFAFYAPDPEPEIPPPSAPTTPKPILKNTISGSKTSVKSNIYQPE
jgi:hypothetical protein